MSKAKRPCRNWIIGKGCEWGYACKFEHDDKLREMNTCLRYAREVPCKPNCHRLPFAHQWKYPGPRHTRFAEQAASSSSRGEREETRRSRSRSPRQTLPTFAEAAMQTDGVCCPEKYTVEEFFSGFEAEWRYVPEQQRKDYKRKLLRTFHPDKWCRGTGPERSTKFAREMTNLIVRRMDIPIS